MKQGHDLKGEMEIEHDFVVNIEVGHDLKAVLWPLKQDFVCLYYKVKS